MHTHLLVVAATIFCCADHVIHLIFQSRPLANINDMQDYDALPHWFPERAGARLRTLYGEQQATPVLHRIIDMVLEHMQRMGLDSREKWNQQDAILITYGDSIKNDAEAPLQTLHRFLRENLQGIVNSVHILPFFPYSSDDGFSVIDYAEVNETLGGWADIEAISQDFNLMADLVINHCSRENLWFIDYINNDAPGRDYFIEMEPGTDVSQVVRPRNTPLLVPVHTRRGTTHVWATFSEDQVDLDFTNPDVLIEFIRFLLLYIEKGARFIRLDAIAFLWKELGSRCIHLRETHEVVKLMRDIVDAAAPHCVLITETNVPNGENISYFGHSDEAHMVYQFSLPPLLLHALHSGNAEYLTRWAIDYPRPPAGCSYLNFTASHDGIGLRPLEGLLPEEQVSELIDAMHEYGGYVAMKSNADGVDTPYEINITLFDALKGTHKGVDQWQVPRFLSSQTLMLSIQGIPAIYIHSLTACPNDYYGVEDTGRTRTINRHSWNEAELKQLLNNHEMPNAIVFNELRRRLQIRGQQEAFHPDSDQRTVDLGKALFSVWRLGENQQLLCITNVTNQAQTVCLPETPAGQLVERWHDLLQDQVPVLSDMQLSLSPYQSVWLQAVS